MKRCPKTLDDHVDPYSFRSRSLRPQPCRGLFTRPILRSCRPQEPLRRRSAQDETLSLHEAMDRFRRFLRRHCVSLAYVLKDSPNPKQWQFATGILLDLDGQKTVVTAGHWVVKLQKKKDAGKLEEVHLRYPHVSEEFEQRRIEADFVSAETMPVADQFDGAFIRLPEPLLNDIERHGNNFFAREQALHGFTEDRHLAIVCGYPSQAIIVTETPAFYTKSSGKIFQHNHVQLGSLAFQSTL